MAGMNAGLILQGQGVDPVNALARGAQGAATINAVTDQNKMRDMFKANGAGIMAGDQNALNQLASLDPTAALGVQNTQLGMQNTRQGMQARTQQMQMQLRQEARQVQQAAAQSTAAERAAMTEQLKSTVAMGLQIQSPEQWDAIMAERNPDFVGMFDQREMLAAEYMSLADSLERFDAQNAAPTPSSPLGKFYADKAAGLVPADAQPPQSGTSVTVNSGENPDVFQDEIDKRSAAMFTTLYDNLPNAQSKIGQVENLAGLLASSETGGIASVKSWLGGFGVETAGLSDIQAVEAAISQMVPAQRTPGSGPMSDADLALFKLSLPRLINTPEGNGKIIATMRGMAEYEAAQSRIAAQVVSRELTRAEGQNALMSLPNPLVEFSRNGQDSAPAMPNAGETVDGYRFKGGDPSQQSNWERI